MWPHLQLYQEHPHAALSLVPIQLPYGWLYILAQAVRIRASRQQAASSGDKHHYHDLKMFLPLYPASR